VSHLSSLKGSG